MTTITEHETPTTEQVVAAMLTENTGTHFLDSGGISGRAWQRNQAAAGDDPVAHFKTQPEAWQGWKGEEWATISLFHWLTARVDYHEATDLRWRRWVDLDYIGAERHYRGRCYNDSSHFGDWLTALVDKGWAERCEFGGGYTYNEENALSQDIVWVPFALTDDCPWADFPTELVAVSIHNGADARGGFTDFRVFELSSYEGIYDFLDYGDYEVTWECNRPLPDPHQLALDGVPAPDPEPHQVYTSVRGGYGEWYDANSGVDLRDKPEELDADDVSEDLAEHRYGCWRRCPCGDVLTITGFHAPCTS